VVLLFFVAYLCLQTDHTKIKVSIFIFTAATPKIDLVDNDEQKKIVHRQGNVFVSFPQNRVTMGDKTGPRKVTNAK